MNPIRQSAIDTINAEAAAVQHLVEQLTDDFEKAVQAILTCKGKVIVTGMGKSGLIGKKLLPHWPAQELQPFLCIRERLIMAFSV